MMETKQLESKESVGLGLDQTLVSKSYGSLEHALRSEIDSQIATAKAYPRSIGVFLDRLESMATLSEEVAASCLYAVPRGGKAIEGPSIRLAEIVSSLYGNIRSGARIIGNDGRSVTAQGVCHDLESNHCVTVEVKRRIVDKDGNVYNEDMQTLTSNAACAIALRNAIFKAIPSALIERVYQKVRQVARGEAETLFERRRKALEYFKEQGIAERALLRALGLRRVEDIDLDKMRILRGMVNAVKNGESLLKDLFEPPELKEEEKRQAALQAQEAYKAE